MACGPSKDTIAVPRERADTLPDAATSCPGPVTASEGVLALYTFDQDEGRAQVADVVGMHNGSVQLGLVVTTEGPEGCGRAFTFGSEGQYFVIDDSPDWDLEVGSVDLWLWLPAEQGDNIGVFSRDVTNRETPGHFSFFVDVDGRAVVRVQPQDASSDNSNDAVACSAAALPRQQWVHLAVNFGPPALELYVNGLLAAGEGANAIDSSWACHQPGAYGIAGNDLPWVVGRSTFRSDATLETLEFPALYCAIDQLRISNQRRDITSNCDTTQQGQSCGPDKTCACCSGGCYCGLICGSDDTCAAQDPSLRCAKPSGDPGFCAPDGFCQ